MAKKLPQIYILLEIPDKNPPKRIFPQFIPEGPARQENETNKRVQLPHSSCSKSSMSKITTFNRVLQSEDI